eukprot:2121357-Pyramimonas_sp.AAC.2
MCIKPYHDLIINALIATTSVVHKIDGALEDLAGTSSSARWSRLCDEDRLVRHDTRPIRSNGDFRHSDIQGLGMIIAQSHLSVTNTAWPL